MTSTPATPSNRPALITWVSGYQDRLTYTRTLHLLANLALGTIYFTVIVTMLSTSAALLVTLIGVPFLIVTLLTARGIAHLERARARILLGVQLPEPAPHRTGWRRLRDSADWRAAIYGLLLLPVGGLTGTLALTGWTVTAAALAYPLYGPTLADPALHLGELQVAGAAADATALLVGILLLLALPRLVRLLARIDAALLRGLLR
jgi:hypothetical protein